MKCKPNQTRTYDPEGFKQRAACLCFRSEREDEVLLVSSSRYPDRWIVPGGGMEPEEEPGGAAVREVYEEAGVKGKLGRLLGVFEQNQDRKHRTYVYVLTVTELVQDRGCHQDPAVPQARARRVPGEAEAGRLPDQWELGGPAAASAREPAPMSSKDVRESLM
ncbi:diphosphoinositol polyphosphate phosphohydrolase 3-beta isoform X2 [Perognathus longimembris pacificus]|uniref:diphosphoinositol polyphosphate phosphohydrolase 3-beta isoform X2 n=1 Tax=Perognathus longimembris pacificus TaxID=214514 RepID=UPI0020197090|nr:diphosphoinositol polyphosphate phosphohydrolase 3-beta isoform X2 [Perognathus longimembris pacificus]